MSTGDDLDPAKREPTRLRRSILQEVPVGSANTGSCQVPDRTSEVVCTLKRCELVRLGVVQIEHRCAADETALRLACTTIRRAARQCATAVAMVACPQNTTSARGLNYRTSARDSRPTSLGPPRHGRTGKRKAVSEKPTSAATASMSGSLIPLASSTTPAGFPAIGCSKGGIAQDDRRQHGGPESPVSAATSSLSRSVRRAVRASNCR